MLSQSSKFTGLGLAVFVGGLFVVPACGSDDNNGGTASGGTGTTGGAATGGNLTGTSGNGTGGGTGGTGETGKGGTGTTGGTAGTGGSGTAGTGGSGAGGTPQVASACKGAVPKEALISNFDDLVAQMWGTGSADTDFSGGFFSYPAAVTLSVAADNLTGSGNVATYSGFGLYVQYCGDASSYNGVKFKISGDVGDSGNVLFYVQTNVGKWADGSKGTCFAPKANEFSDCVYPSVPITGVTSVPQEVTILWTDVGNGKPAAAATTDGSDVIGFQWAFDWMVGTPAYDASLSIDDMELVGDGAGTGGADGAGGNANSGGAGGAL